jgi:NAD+ synthase (glutamine-hydrolysing)
MKVLLAQTNTTPGDFEGNFKQINSAMSSAYKQKADMVVFPELSIPGYLCKDMMFQHQFVRTNLIVLYDIVQLSLAYENLVTVVGYIDINKTGIGKPFRNMLAVIKNGAVIGEYQKHLLPFYDVFDEGRYFEPGKELLILNIAGEKVGFCICEDIWNDKGSDDYNYEDNPINSYRKRGITTLVNISSSPFTNGKPKNRYRMLEKVAADFTLIYVNQHGGQDDLVFDGHSCVIRNGAPVAILTAPTEAPYGAVSKLVETNNGGAYVALDFLDKSEIEILYEMTKMGLHDYMKKSGFTQAVLGSSGGIDSALVATLACEVLGKENVHCIMMPSVYSSEGSVTDAKALHANIGCKEYLVPIDHKNEMHHINNHTIKTNNELDYAIHNYNTGKNTYASKFFFNKAAEENLQARMRGMNVMFFSNAWGALALTTGNKTELATGYCTLYGDMNGGFAPISDLYKMQVYAMCNFINKKFGKEMIPKAILDKAPSAELAPGQTDEASLLPYPILDEIVKQYVENYVDSFQEFRKVFDEKTLIKYFGTENCWEVNAVNSYRKIIRLININEFKRRQAAPGIKLSRVAFGTGRRIPICKKVLV